MKKLYPRICSNCGRRFLGKKMDYRCPICIENVKVKIEVRGNRVIETRGQACVGSSCGIIVSGKNGGCYARSR